MDEQKKSVGAFWKKTSANGNEYYSGNIEINGEKIYLVGFNNTKKADNQPDIRVFISEKKVEEKTNNSFLQQGLSATKEIEDDEPIDVQDIPF